MNAREKLRGTTALMWAAEQRHAEAVKVLLAAGADPALKSAGAGLPRNYLANRVNTRTVDLAQQRRKRAADAGRTYEEQLAFEQKRRARARRAARPRAGARPGRPAARQPGGTRARRRAAGGGPAGRGSRRGGGAGAGAGAGAAARRAQSDDDNEVVFAGLVGSGGGGLTALIFAAREGDIESARALLDAGANVNQTTEYGWTPLLTAVNNRNYKLAHAAARARRRSQPGEQGRLDAALPRHRQPQHRGRRLPGAEAGSRSPRDDQGAPRQGREAERAGEGEHAHPDHLHDAVVLGGRRHAVHPRGAVERHRADEAAARSAAPTRRRTTVNGDNALTASAGIGWVEGVTYERSPKENVEAMRMLLDLGLDPNHANVEGRTALMGAALKGRSDVVQLLVERGATLDQHDHGSRDTDKVGSIAAGATWQPIDYAEGLVRVGVQSAIARPETAALIRKMMIERGMKVPPVDRNINSICVVSLCQGTSP